MTAKNLALLFNDLNDRGITVCEGCTEQQVLQKRQPSDLGYCFYRPHEGLYAYETGTLYLTWGSYQQDDLVRLIVVEAIKDEARACNIQASWKGSIKDRVELCNLDKSYFQKFS